MSARKLIRQWRVSKGEPLGLHVWFDPRTETVRLFELDPLEIPGVDDVCEGDDRDGTGRPSSEKNEFADGELPF